MVHDDVQKAKERFATLLCYLVQEGFTDEHISNVILRDPFFLFFERNALPAFLESPLEEVIERHFHKKVFIDYGKSLPTEVFWAGEMYVTLVADEHIPLQRCFLVCPVTKMVSFFNPYHEMNASNLCARYIEEEKKESVLKCLLKGRVSVGRLSMLTGISQRTLISYADNEKFFSASLSNAYALSSYFQVPIATITKRSAFRPVVSSLLGDNRFRELLSARLSAFYGTELDAKALSADYVPKERVKVELQEKEAFADMFSLVIYRKGKKPTPIQDSDFRYLFALALEDLRAELPQGTLAL